MIEAGESTVHVISTEQHAEYQFEFWAMQHLDTAFSQILYDMISCKKKQKCASALFILSLSAWKLKHLSCPAFRTESTSLDLSPFMGRFFLCPHSGPCRLTLTARGGWAWVGIEPRPLQWGLCAHALPDELLKLWGECISTYLAIISGVSSVSCLVMVVLKELPLVIQ